MKPPCNGLPPTQSPSSPLLMLELADWGRQPADVFAAAAAAGARSAKQAATYMHRWQQSKSKSKTKSGRAREQPARLLESNEACSREKKLAGLAKATARQQVRRCRRLARLLLRQPLFLGLFYLNHC